MLKLKNITKDYQAGDSTVHALRQINVSFRKSEFVSILGPSGCGKTTLLNIIGGLDRYTSGDLVIAGRSTKEYKDRDWDAYRNHKIGFVFQTYNLIPHQSVLANVELALTLSGIGKDERRRKAKLALEQVGLGDQLKKRPNQLSGGQMQRVAIARALVNDPDIILADEPTGALDTVTSVQIMDILKQISGNKLIIMVTHNPELADKYSDRIINLVDGNVVGDSNPCSDEEYDRQLPGNAEGRDAVKKNAPDNISDKSKKSNKGKKNKEKVSMSFFTALSLSFNNLLTKKGRTFITSLAGSIGIIGIALILALSNGIQLYIDSVQRDSLASYPLEISSETVDYSQIVNAMANKEEEEREPGKVYSNTSMLKMLTAFSSQIKKNNLAEFKKYIDSGVFDEHISAVKYEYEAKMKIYSYNTSSVIASAPAGNQVVYPSSIVSDMMNIMGGSVSEDMSSMATSLYNLEPWSEILEGRNGEIINPLIKEQYELVGSNSRFPENKNEIIIVLTKNDTISDVSLYSMGIKDSGDMEKILEAVMNNRADEVDSSSMTFDYDQLLGLRFRLVLPCDEYSKNADGTWSEITDKDSLIENGLELKVVGLVRPKENTSSTSIKGVIGYTSALTKYVIQQCEASEILKDQIANKDIDVLTGKPFVAKTYGKENVGELINSLPEAVIALMIENINNNEQLSQFGIKISTREELIEIMKNYMSDAQIDAMAGQMLGSASESTYAKNIALFGNNDLNSPKAINIYAKSFESKELISDIITEYNNKAEKEGREDDVIRYTDFAALLMSSFSDIVRFVSYGLMAFVSVSLVVSSIMIGIITYTSVLERTKEIGILRSIGASKRNIRSVFNAETAIIGLVSGIIGIILTLLIILPINLILYVLTGISGIASLPVVGAVILIALSMFLTLIAGIIPASFAANKDPVKALRSE